MRQNFLIRDIKVGSEAVGKSQVIQTEVYGFLNFILQGIGQIFYALDGKKIEEFKNDGSEIALSRPNQTNETRSHLRITKTI